MRILNLQISKDVGLRICENQHGGIDLVEFDIDGHYVTAKPGVPERLILTIPLERREIVSEFIKP